MRRYPFSPRTLYQRIIIAIYFTQVPHAPDPTNMRYVDNLDFLTRTHAHLYVLALLVGNDGHPPHPGIVGPQEPVQSVHTFELQKRAVLVRCGGVIGLQN